MLGEIELTRAGISPPTFAPTPLNLFMNVPIQADRTTFTFEKATVEKGQYVCLRAEVDVVIVLSACPQDIVLINGGAPADAYYEIL